MEYPPMTTKTARRPSRELRAMAFAIADEIETVAQRYIARGYSRKAAVTLAITQIAGA
jgi:hypothetical protein